jgi:hypothetical protein
VVDYTSADFSDYSFSLGNVKGTDGLTDTSLQDWIKRFPRVGQRAATYFCGAPGTITIRGETNPNGNLIASSIVVSGQ